MKKIILINSLMLAWMPMHGHSGELDNLENEKKLAATNKLESQTAQNFADSEKKSAEAAKMKAEKEGIEITSTGKRIDNGIRIAGALDHTISEVISRSWTLFGTTGLDPKHNLELLTRPWPTGKDCSLGTCLPYKISIEKIVLQKLGKKIEEKSEEIFSTGSERAKCNLIEDVLIFNRAPFPYDQISGNTRGFKFKAEIGYLGKLMPHEEHGWKTWNLGWWLNARPIFNNKINSRFYPLPSYHGIVTYSCLDYSGNKKATLTVPFRENNEICLSCDEITSTYAKITR
jgi:hypothetical protein